MSITKNIVRRTQIHTHCKLNRRDEKREKINHKQMEEKLKGEKSVSNGFGP